MFGELLGIVWEIPQHKLELVPRTNVCSHTHFCLFCVPYHELPIFPCNTFFSFPSDFDGTASMCSVVFSFLSNYVQQWKHAVNQDELLKLFVMKIHCFPIGLYSVHRANIAVIYGNHIILALERLF